MIFETYHHNFLFCTNSEIGISGVVYHFQENCTLHTDNIIQYIERMYYGYWRLQNLFRFWRGWQFPLNLVVGKCHTKEIEEVYVLPCHGFTISWHDDESDSKKKMHYNVSKLKSFQVFSVPNSEKNVQFVNLKTILTR